MRTSPFTKSPRELIYREGAKERNGKAQRASLAIHPINNLAALLRDGEGECPPLRLSVPFLRAFAVKSVLNAALRRDFMEGDVLTLLLGGPQRPFALE